MKKKFKYLIWAIIIISHSAFAIITKQLSTQTNANYNFTGTIVNKNYQSSLAISPNTIKTYSYVEHNNKPTPNSTNKNFTEAITAEHEDILFTLIPRRYQSVTEPNYDIHDQISRMNKYLDINYFSPTLKNIELQQESQAIADQEIQLYLQSVNDYLIDQQLDNNFNKEEQAIVGKSIVGRYGLFMPTDINNLDKFNGCGRTLPLAVSVIEDLLITVDYSTTYDKNIIKNQIIWLQFLIFKAIEQAKTVIFLPEFTARKNTGAIRLPIALINKVSLNETNGNITLNLLFFNNSSDIFLATYDFISARNSLIEFDNTNNNWEFIDYTLELGINYINIFKPLQYRFNFAQIKINNCINQQKNNRLHQNADTNFQAQCVSISVDKKLKQIASCQEKNYLPPKLLQDLLLTYNNTNIAINKKLSGIQDSNNISTEGQSLIEDLIRHNNNSFQRQCSDYSRKCLFKFSCCDEYWCCHRTHNQDSKHKNCNINSKSRNVEFIKCLICNHEQVFAKYCQRCKTKFSEYYCGICKNLTETKKHPFHCEKCNICRNNGDKAFHCDICGICLDLKLRGNHKCRAGSDHDKCCICLEDTFSGCIVLPCSHKIHANCSRKMLKRGINSCPVCRESFFHKK